MLKTWSIRKHSAAHADLSQRNLERRDTARPKLKLAKLAQMTYSQQLAIRLSGVAETAISE